MKPRGKAVIPFTDKELQMVEEYLTSDKSLEEIARSYDVPLSSLAYKVKKYRRLEEQKKLDEDEN